MLYYFLHFDQVSLITAGWDANCSCFHMNSILKLSSLLDFLNRKTKHQKWKGIHPHSSITYHGFSLSFVHLWSLGSANTKVLKKQFDNMNFIFCKWEKEVCIFWVWNILLFSLKLMWQQCRGFAWSSLNKYTFFSSFIIQRFGWKGIGVTISHW